MHRRPPFRSRRYSPSQALLALPPQLPKEEPIKNTLGLSSIPLPNEVEHSDTVKPGQRNNFFSDLVGRIHIDDLILLGLVFLFIDEGRSGAEDDLIIVLLLYLFLAGRN